MAAVSEPAEFICLWRISEAALAHCGLGSGIGAVDRRKAASRNGDRRVQGGKRPRKAGTAVKQGGKRPLADEMTCGLAGRWSAV